LRDESIADVENINGLSGVGIYHCPHAFAISYHLVAYGNAEVSTCEIAHDGINPGVNRKAFVGRWQLVHLYGEARKHPCPVDWVQITHAITSVIGMKIGGIEQMIA
jgi:hypothetical protein